MGETNSFAEVVGGPGARQEVRNERALLVYNRVQHKLTGSSFSLCLRLCVTHDFSPSTGRDFNPDIVLPVTAQVDKLILQATSLENLCQCFSGW
jgi:FKBP12-rapamycin complex-associated protein